MNLRHCPICKAETSPTEVLSTSGEDAPLGVTVRRLPVLECPRGHRSFVAAGFPAALLEHLLAQDAPRLPVSRSRGLLFRHHLCTQCGAELHPGDDQPHVFHLDVAFSELPAFEVDLSLPVSHCSRCGSDQLHSLKDLTRHAPNALARAFKAAQLAPA